MQFVSPRNRPARRESISPSAYGAVTPGGFDADREPSDSVIAWDEIARGFFWTMGAAAGGGALAIASKMIGLRS